jgi:ubiquinone/menaquinone biosynthesis C-methylase UbiE
MNKESVLSAGRFDDPGFAKKYAFKHAKMSVKFAGKIADMLKTKNFECGRILDSGCGSGITLIHLAKKFPKSEFYGIDLSDTMIEIANDLSRQEKVHEKITFLKGDVCLIPIKANYFDAAININMVHLVDNPIAMLNEINRLLKSDGLFFISDLKRSPLGILEKEIKSALTVKEAQALIAGSNLLKGKFSSDLIWWYYQNIKQGY